LNVIAPVRQYTILWFFETVYLPMRLLACSSDTIESYRQSLKHLERFKPGVLLSEIDARFIANFQASLATKMAPASVNCYLRPIKAILNFAADEENALIEKAPKIRMLKEPKRTPLALTIDEFCRVINESQKVIREIGGIAGAAWWLALLLVAWETGLRYRALLSIRTIDFLPESGGLYARAETQKNGEGQWFFLPPETIAAVQKIMIPSEPLLFHPGVAPETVGRWFRVLLDQSKIYAPMGCGLRFHRIRKSKASYTELAGGDAQRALGHSCRAVTERYLDPRIVRPPQVAFMPKLKIN
jgi:integrase